MTPDHWARLCYLVLLGLLVGGYFVVQGRANLGRTVRHAMLWALIFGGVIAGLGLWDDIRSTVIPRQSVFSSAGRVEVPRAGDGHFYLTLAVNDVPVRFVVDTGATEMVLSREDAARVGLSPGALDFTAMAYTANGPVATAPVRLTSVAIGGIVDNGVRAVVNGGEMDTSLLGMGYLNRFRRLEMTANRLTLER